MSPRAASTSTTVAGPSAVTVPGVVVDTSSDGGSIVIAWPAGLVPDPKFNLVESFLFDATNEPPQLAPSGPFIAKTQPNGTFILEIPVPQNSCDYNLVIVSANDKDHSVAETDRSQLAKFFCRSRENAWAI